MPKLFLKHRLDSLNPRPGRGGGELMHPPQVHPLKLPLNRRVDRTETLNTLWGIAWITFGSYVLAASGQVTELCHHIVIYSLRPIFQRNRIFGSLTCCT